MKNFLLIGVAMALLSGCFNEDVSSWSEQECKDAGFKFEKQEVMNYRSGKLEIRTKCTEK
ncbi:MAG: hypothetical protein M0P43_04190 [Arcobacteraceae bacterium]|jgi:hypothetical protein|nr:hypothetical protein [Arcobacteraceae bacterium]MDY0328130.1 hypothetical protein [Arcobacteraceae bacterium]